MGGADPSRLHFGGTTLQGESYQQYGKAKRLVMNEEKSVTLRIRLMAADEDEPVVHEEECTSLEFFPAS